MKNTQEFEKIAIEAKSVPLLPGVSVIMICLNNEELLPGCFESLSQHQYDQIVMVDGGSTDRSIEIARQYEVDVFPSARGMGRQHILSVFRAKHEILVGIESDTIFPPGELEKFINEFLSSDFIGMEPRKAYRDPKNFMEYGLDVQLRLRSKQLGQTEFICGPTIYRTDFYREHCKNFNFDGYCADTVINEYWKKNGFKVGISSAQALIQKKFTFKKFFKKQTFYGYGDWDFLRSFWSSWTWARRLKSMTHVLRTYGIRLPFEALRMGKPRALPYFFLCVLFRYFGFFKKMTYDFFGKSVDVQ